MADPMTKLTQQRASLMAYAQSKIEAEDWHAVADAAMDLREIDAKLSILRPTRDDVLFGAKHLFAPTPGGESY